MCSAWLQFPIPGPGYTKLTTRSTNLQRGAIILTLQENGSIFYGQKPGKSEWGESVCEIVGVFSGPEPHVVVMWTDGSLSVRDMDAVGEAGVPIPCTGWAVIKTLRGEPR